MFTGLIEEVGKVEGIVKRADGLNLVIGCNKVIEGTKLGDSIAVNGVCLTVTDLKGGLITFDVSKETIKRTNLSKINIKEAVNLERAMMVGNRFGGHIVQGHVDTVGYISSIKPTGEHTEFLIEIPFDYVDYVIEKGSIAVDGISLTINYIDKNRVKLNIIPHTFKNTNLMYRKTGDSVNLEFDIVGKYVVEMIRKYGFSNEDRLKNLLEHF